MFLLVSGRHVGAHPDGHQHGGSIQISPHILHKKNCYDLKLGETLCIFTFFLFSESGLYLLNGFNFYFEWRDTENQQLQVVFYHVASCHCSFSWVCCSEVRINIIVLN